MDLNFYWMAKVVKNFIVLIDNYRWNHNIQNKLIALAESSGLRVGIANFLPLRSHLAPFLSSLTSGMEEIVMHERYHDMQLTY